MMYNLLLCDDEPIILKGLTRSVPWQDYKLQVQASFEDGREVIAYLQEHEVDVILTDIDMADVTGLQLAKHVARHHPQVKVVILSGLKDFDYAKQAIQYNVFHYLVKPIDLDEIDDVMSELVRQLDAEREERQRLAREERRFAEVLPMLREQLFTDLLLGALRNRPETIQSRLELLQLPVTIKSQRTAVYRLILSREAGEAAGVSDRQNDSAIHYIQAELLELQLAFGILLRYGRETRLIAVGEATERSDSEQSLESELAALALAVAQLYGLKVIWQLEARYANLMEAAQTIVPVQLDWELSEGACREAVLKPGEYERLVQQYKLLVSNLYDGNTDQVASLADRLFQEMEQLPIIIVQRLMIDLFAMISSHIADWGGRVGGLTGGQLDYSELLRQKSHEQIRRWCQRVFDLILAHMSSGREKTHEKLFAKVKAYIQAHYAEDVNLEEMADQVYLNPVYFSRLFKQEMGINFTEYVTKVRMAKAKELLQSGRYKSYEVSEMTGYRNSKYFTKVFKQETGYTPMAFSRMFEESE
ncbi:response regulator [Paenibacillus daejeonensis]|uniref:response regulator n=1 Tax=Paenibacillus daejeonensis TaxID=135193 RepID=UPI00146C2A0D|nr:response regulator [Paenibacillus daejeonensis]